MNKRLKKKIYKREWKKRERIFDSLIGTKICPICGSHTIQSGRSYACVFCNRKYLENEVAPQLQPVSAEEYAKLRGLYLARYLRHAIR